MGSQDRKKTALAAFHSKMRGIAFDGGNAKIGAGRVSVLFGDSTQVVIQMLTIRGGLGAGEFAAYPTLGIYGGSIFNILKASKLDGGTTYPKDLIVQGTSHELVPTSKRGVYAFRESADVNAVVGKMVADIQKFYIPIVRGFTADYPAGVEWIVATHGAHARKPFAMGVTLLVLAGELARVEDMITVAKGDEGFWDYHKAKDPQAMVQRIAAAAKKSGQDAVASAGGGHRKHAAT